MLKRKTRFMREQAQMPKILTLRVWILIIIVALSILAIRPMPFSSGIEIKSVSANSLASDNGLKQGMKILSVNGADIKSIDDYDKAISYLDKRLIYSL